MPLSQETMKEKALFEQSKKAGSEHLEWCSDVSRIPKELPNVDKEIKTEKIQIETDNGFKQIDFPVNEQTFNVDGYGYKVFSDKSKLEVRVMRWKSSGKGSSYNKRVDYTDSFVKAYDKKEFAVAEKKIEELNQNGFMVESQFFNFYENNQANTVLVIRGRKPYGSTGGAKQSEQSEKSTNGNGSKEKATDSK